MADQQTQQTQQTQAGEGQTGAEDTRLPGVGNDGSDAPPDILDDQQQGQPAGEGPPGQQGQQQQQQADEEPTGITREDIAAILREAGFGATTQQAQQTQQQQPQRQYTQAEYEQAFNVWKPDAALVALLRHEDPNKALEALIALRDGLIRQSQTMADYRAQQIRDALYNEHVAPLAATVSEQTATAFRTDFFKQYPDLEKYEVIVDAVAAKLQQSGWAGKNRGEVMKRFADDTNAVVQTLLAGRNGGNGGTNTGTGGRQQQSTQATTKRRMSTLSTGGQGGQSRPGATTGAKSGPPGIEVFD